MRESPPAVGLSAAVTLTALYIAAQILSDTGSLKIAVVAGYFAFSAWLPSDRSWGWAGSSQASWARFGGS
jgi:hypothetical protein